MKIYLATTAGSSPLPPLLLPPEIKCQRLQFESRPQRVSSPSANGIGSGPLAYPRQHSMYSASSSARPKSVDDDDRRRRGSDTAVNHPPLPSISTRSPTQYLPYSPTNGTHPPSPYHPYSSRPSTSTVMPAPAGVSPRLGPPPSPKGAGSTHGSAAYVLRDLSNSTYYDPISEHREGPTGWNNLAYPSNSPVQVRGLEEGSSVPFHHGSRVGSANHDLLESRTTPFCGLPHRGKSLPKYLSISSRSPVSSSIIRLSPPACASTQPT